MLRAWYPFVRQQLAVVFRQPALYSTDPALSGCSSIFVPRRLSCNCCCEDSRTMRRRGLVSALRLIVHGLTRFSDAVNNKISTERACRQSLGCLITPTIPFQASHMNMYCSRTCLNSFRLVTIFTISGNAPMASPSFPRLSISLTKTF